MKERHTHTHGQKQMHRRVREVEFHDSVLFRKKFTHHYLFTTMFVPPFSPVFLDALLFALAGRDKGGEWAYKKKATIIFF